MLEYNILFFSVILLIAFNTVYKSIILERLSLLIVFILFILIAGLRLDISSDYSEYEFIFNEIQNKGTFDSFFIEPGYIFLTKLIINFGFNFKFFIFFVAFLSLSCKYIFVNKFSNDKILSSLLFLVFYLLLYDLGAIRRGLALGFSAIAIIYYLKDKFYKSISFVLVAASFHVSAIILIPFFFFRNIIINIRIFILILITSFFFQYVITNLVEFDFLNQLNNVVAAKAMSYIDSSEYFVSGFSISIGLFLRVLIVMLIIHKKEKIAKVFPHVDRLIYLNIISFVFLIVFDELRIFTSVAIYFKITEIILIPLLLIGVRKSTKFIFTLTILIYAYFSFYKLINNPLETDYLPYKSIFYNGSLY